MQDRSKLSGFNAFRWHEVELRSYKETGAGHRGVSRQTLSGEDSAEHGISSVTRYFEIAAGGFSSLERHEHAHSVTVLRGRGSLILGRDVHPVRPFDHVYIVADCLHQFYADADECLGFLCVVDRERDRPRPADPAEIADLQKDPALAVLLARMQTSKREE